MNQAAQKSGKKPLIIVSSIVILLLAIIGIMFALALSDPNASITPVEQTKTGVEKLVKAAVTGEPAQLSAEEMNAILVQTKVKNVRFMINSNNTADAYAPVEYKGIKFRVSANLTITTASEKQISATVNSMKIGRLPVNPTLLMQYCKEVLPKEISVDKNVLRIDSSLLDTYILGDMVGMNINSLTIADQSFVVNVTGNLDKLKDYITKNLQSYIGLLS